MIRIRTRIGEDRVFTLWFNGKWVTIANIGGRSSSVDTTSFLEAGQNHLTLSLQIKERHDRRRQVDSKLLHDAGHPHASGGISDRDDGAHREGPNRDGGDGGAEILQTDPSSDEDQESLQLETANQELKENTNEP